MGSLQDERAEEKAFDREKVRFIPSRSLSHGANLILCSNSREESEETRLVEDSCVSYLISHFANPFWRNSRPFSPVRRPQQRHRGKSVVKLYPASGLLASLSLSLSLSCCHSPRWMSAPLVASPPWLRIQQSLPTLSVSPQSPFLGDNYFGTFVTQVSPYCIVFTILKRTEHETNHFETATTTTRSALDRIH